MLNENFIFLSAAINLIAGFTYAWGTWKGNVQPNRVTWFLWTLVPTIALSAQLYHGVGWSSLFVVVEAFIAALILLASFLNPKAYWQLRTHDYICGLLALSNLLFWAISKNPLHAIIFSILADILAAAPTLIKAYQAPQTEDGKAYALTCFSATLALFTIQNHSFMADAFTASIILINITLVILIYRKSFKSFHRKASL